MLKANRSYRARVISTLVDPDYPYECTIGPRNEGGDCLETYEWVFSTGTRIDTQPPTVVSVSPSAAATEVSPNVPVVVTFSESVNVESARNDRVVLMDLTVDRKVETTLTASADRKALTLTPALPLKFAHRYAVQI